MADELDALSAAEEDFAREVAAVLDEVAADFARELDDATELVAARFSVSRIGRMWAQRMPRLVRRLLGIAEQAGEAAAGQVDAELPDDWEDLPGRHDQGDDLPDGIGQYVTETEHLLRAVGDRLAEAAVRALAEGVDAGEDIEALRARLRAVFAREGAQLGDGREALIAQTEATRAWNAATLAAARALTGPERPIVKQWRTRGDSAVRDAHDAVDGFVRLLDDPFTVAGVDMQHPGDPTAPPALVCNCRCVLRLQLAPDRAASAYESQDPSPAEYSDARRTAPVTSRTAAASEGGHTGGMIALIPSADDVARLALDDGEPAEELHLTLFYLGDDASQWDADQRAELIEGVRARVSSLPGPVVANAFGVNHWNPQGDDPVWVWAISDTRDDDEAGPTLQETRYVVQDALEDTHERPEIPRQHSPWVAHVTGAYTPDTWPLTAMAERLGPITFDRVRLAFAEETTDIKLGPEEAPMDEATAASLPIRTWSTPKGQAALAYENQETGDGRIFAAGSLYWEAGPWPLQYADEMLMGHEGAELAGAIEELSRDGDDILGRGPLYLTQRAGADAVTLLELGAPLGVSVDLDGVDVEFRDRTMTEDEDGGLVLAASLATASVMRLEDGGWILSATTPVEATAAGTSMSRRQHRAQLFTGPNGEVSAAALEHFDRAKLPMPRVSAAAGDSDDPDAGVVVHQENTGDFLVRITRARVRGATLVSMPAYNLARIVLDPVDEETAASAAQTAAQALAAVTAASGPSDEHQRVVAYVCASPVPVGAREVATALDLTMTTVRGHLRRASRAGRLVRIAQGLYVGPSTLPEGPEVEASAADGDDPALTELVASAWTAMRDLPPMPAEWFREPTPEELPPGSGGVHYSNGRIFGWIARTGEPHAGFSNQRLTIESLGEIDLTHFLRARFALDDGTFVRAGAFTMNAPHTRDGAECDDVKCQFDDTRTVAGVITCGMSEGGMWFSGAAAPWLSEWDRTVFMGCQPSYHMKKGADGRWQLRAVLSVPVPGHSSPLLAAAVERGNLALAASAAAVVDDPDTVLGHRPDMSADNPDNTADTSAATPAEQGGHRPDTSADTVPDNVATLLENPDFLDALSAALTERQSARAEEVARLTALVDGPGIATLTTADLTLAGPNPKGDA